MTARRSHLAWPIAGPAIGAWAVIIGLSVVPGRPWWEPRAQQAALWAALGLIVNGARLVLARARLDAQVHVTADMIGAVDTMRVARDEALVTAQVHAARHAETLELLYRAQAAQANSDAAMLEARRDRNHAERCAAACAAGLVRMYSPRPATEFVTLAADGTVIGTGSAVPIAGTMTGPGQPAAVFSVVTLQEGVAPAGWELRDAENTRVMGGDMTGPPAPSLGSLSTVRLPLEPR